MLGSLPRSGPSLQHAAVRQRALLLESTNRVCCQAQAVACKGSCPMGSCFAHILGSSEGNSKTQHFLLLSMILENTEKMTKLLSLSPHPLYTDLWESFLSLPVAAGWFPFCLLCVSPAGSLSSVCRGELHPATVTRGDNSDLEREREAKQQQALINSSRSEIVGCPWKVWGTLCRR